MQHKEIQEQQHTLPYYTSQQLRNIFRHLDINICNLWIMEVTLNRWFSFCLILKFVALHFLPLVIVRNYYYYKYRFPFPTNRQKPLGIRFPKHVCMFPRVEESISTVNGDQIQIPRESTSTSPLPP